MDIFPSIDIRAGKVVRLVQGDYDRQIDYADGPVAVAKGFIEAGASWIHSVDLDGAKTGRAYNFETLRRILSAVDVQVQIGGGIRSEETIIKLVDAGAARVVIGTRGLEDWEWFERIVHEDRFAGRIVLGLDAREGRLATHGWTRQTSTSAVELAQRIRDWPVAAIVYTDIARDGTLTGPNFEQIEAMARATNIPVIASGGIGRIDDVARLATLPVAGAIIGRALYEGTIDLAEAIKIARGA